MAATYGSGSQSPPVIGRPLERVFEEAQHTGEVTLSGRKLKDYPKISSKFDLVDTIVSDLSKNRLGEVPHEVCEYRSMEKLNCYHNVIKVIPEAIMQLEALTHLNLSRNQLSVLPPTLCHLKTLEVLLASNNKLVSLPEEIGNLEKLMDLDVSCNEISHLPGQIGDLTSLRCLNVRRNLLVELPHEICKLNLRKLDFSSNRIEKIPTVFRKIESLEEMVLDHNPLSLPPAHICTRGRQHIMKFLQIEAIKEDRKRGILNDMDMKKLARKSLPPQQTSDDLRNMLLESPESRWKRHTVLSADSGYSTTDSLEKCGWSPSEVTPTSDYDDANSLALKAAEAVKEQRQGRDMDHHRRYAPDPYRKPTHDYAEGPDFPPPPPNLSPRAEDVSPVPIQTTQHSPPAHLSSVALEDEFTRELTRQRAEYERRKKAAEQLRLQHEQEEDVKIDEKEERRRAAIKLQEEQRALMERQREERQREERQKEEARQLEAQEEARRQEEERQKEEARLREEQKKEEAKQEPRKTEGVRRMKGESSSYGYTASLHEEYYGRSMYDHGGYDYSNQNFYISDYGYRKQPLGSSSSFKEERKIHNNSTQYRRTTSDTATRRLQANQNTNTHVDNLNYINRNGVDENVNNSSSTTPIPSPSGSQNSIPSSPSTAPVSNIPSLSRVRESADRSSPHHSPVVRRAKASDRSGVSSPTPGRGTSRVGGTTSGSRLQGTTKKNHSTTEEEFKQKHQAMKNQHSQESNLVRRRVEDSKLKTIQKDAVHSYVSKVTAARSRGDTDEKKRSTTSRNTNVGSTTRGTRSGKCLNGQTDRHPKSKEGHSGSVLSQASMKLLEDYKDADPNFTIRRQHEQRLEELEQMDQLRSTIESRLKVTLPDNLPDALKDGVVLCHLANQIRPRSVASIHVPSPAVPKLTMAKCRRNVENFLDACRKIGVDQEQICSAHDILEEKGISRVAITVAALVAIGTNPKQSAV